MEEAHHPRRDCRRPLLLVIMFAVVAIGATLLSFTAVALNEYAKGHFIQDGNDNAHNEPGIFRRLAPLQQFANTSTLLSGTIDLSGTAMIDSAISTQATSVASTGTATTIEDAIIHTVFATNIQSIVATVQAEASTAPTSAISFITGEVVNNATATGAMVSEATTAPFPNITTQVNMSAPTVVAPFPNSTTTSKGTIGVLENPITTAGAIMQTHTTSIASLLTITSTELVATTSITQKVMFPNTTMTTLLGPKDATMSRSIFSATQLLTITTTKTTQSTSIVTYTPTTTVSKTTTVTSGSIGAAAVPKECSCMETTIIQTVTKYVTDTQSPVLPTTSTSLSTPSVTLTIDSWETRIPQVPVCNSTVIVTKVGSTSTQLVEVLKTSTIATSSPTATSTSSAIATMHSSTFPCDKDKKTATATTTATKPSMMDVHTTTTTVHSAVSIASTHPSNSSNTPTAHRIISITTDAVIIETTTIQSITSITASLPTVAVESVSFPNTTFTSISTVTLTIDSWKTPRVDQNKGVSNSATLPFPPTSVVFNKPTTVHISGGDKTATQDFVVGAVMAAIAIFLLT